MTVGAILVIVVAILAILEIKYDSIPFITLEDPTGDIDKLLVALIIIAYTWLILHYLGLLFEKITLPKIESHAQVRSIWKLVSYIVWGLLLIILVLSMIGEVSSLVVYIGLLSAALAFVMQKPLLDITAWAIITYRRIYRIGDRVMLGEVKGYVLDIKLMHTELREFGEWMRGDTFTGRIVTVHNGVLFDHPIYNYTRDFPFVWDELANLVTYESDIEVAKKYMLESAKEVVGDLMRDNYEKYRRRMEIRDLEQLLLKEPELRMELADSGVNIFVLYFCPVELRRKIKSEITDRIWKRFMADPKVGIAYPHMQILGKLG